MTTPAELIADLDDVLAEMGEDCSLARGTYSVTVRAFVRAASPEELMAGIQQTDSFVILSPTQILAAAWPNNPAPASPPVWMPKVNDKLTVQGRQRNIGFVQPTAVQGQIVRIELRVTG